MGMSVGESRFRFARNAVAGQIDGSDNPTDSRASCSEKNICQRTIFPPSTV
jgi:hypothetical protein